MAKTMSKLIAWSWSRIDLFNQCPRKFYLQNIAKAPNFKFRENDASRRGKRIHQLFKDAALKMLKMKAGAGLKEGVDGGYPEEIYPYMGLLHKLILRADAVTVEDKYAIDKDFNECSYFDTVKTWFRYEIDFAAKFGKRAVMLDWKTGKNRGVNDQLKLYAALIMMLIWDDVDEVTTYYMYVDHNQTAKQTFFRKDLDVMWDSIVEQADAIQLAADNHEWVCRESGLCKDYCNATPEQCEVKAKL